MTALPLLVFVSSAHAAVPRRATTKEKTAIRRAIDDRSTESDQCYRADVARSKRKPVKGLVSLRLVINEKGKVLDATSIHNTTRSRALADCLIRVVRKISFAKYRSGGVVAHYAFRFPPKNL